MKPNLSRPWRTPKGDPVACLEKLKVLEQNLAEFVSMASDILEDAALMGCDAEQVRSALQEHLANITVQYNDIDQ